MPRTPVLRSRKWCFTINNPTEDDEESVYSLRHHSSYLICGSEKGQDGTPHLQCFVMYKNYQTFEQMRKLLPRAHFEIAKGSPVQNFEYCSKDGDFTEYGQRPQTKQQQGEREKQRWDNIKELAKQGKLEEIDPKVFVVHYKTLQAIAKDHTPMPPDTDGTVGEWYYGQTGTGKSRTAREENPGAYLKMCNKWWDGYQGEDAVIIEDFDKKHDVLGHHLKIWADRYAFPAEVKGGKMNIRPKKLIVTSNYHPEDIWQDVNTLEPIKRRFKIKHFSVF